MTAKSSILLAPVRLLRFHFDIGACAKFPIGSSGGVHCLRAALLVT